MLSIPSRSSALVLCGRQFFCFEPLARKYSYSFEFLLPRSIQSAQVVEGTEIHALRFRVPSTSAATGNLSIVVCCIQYSQGLDLCSFETLPVFSCSITVPDLRASGTMAFRIATLLGLPASTIQLRNS